MAEYQLEVSTGGLENAGTWDYIYITLIGEKGQSERTSLDNYGKDFKPGAVSIYTVKSHEDLGQILLVKVEKDPYFFFVHEDEWFCSKIVVKTPAGESISFPCYRWVSRGECVELRSGTAVKMSEEEHLVFINHRKKELIMKRGVYMWSVDETGLPHTSKLKLDELPAEVLFTVRKANDLEQQKLMIGIELKIRGLVGSVDRWKRIEDLKRILPYRKTFISEYVAQHWKDDDFYGYQFLNGVNPCMIKRCSELPPNLPVTEEMVKPFLRQGSSLEREMKEGNMFLTDYSILEGIPTRSYEGQRLHVATGFCLFYLSEERRMMPVAIQLSQQPSDKNPIFLPSDTDSDWTLAKMFIRNADFQIHQSVIHYQNTHGLAEVFTVALVRCFPVVHPVYKLLIPHCRGTLYINHGGRKVLLGPDGPFAKSSLGLEGITELMKRSHAEITYGSLCLPDSIAQRGLESVPDFYYRDDGVRLWSIINRFVQDVVGHYYPADADVIRDSELQDWIQEIFIHGFMRRESSGIPSSLATVRELVKFITMVMFTVSAQHTAVNSGQFDYQSSVANGSLLLCKPPPTTKGESSKQTILDMFPNVGETVSFVALAALLSATLEDFVPLGSYPEERFVEPAPKRMIEEFQKALSDLSAEVTARNSQLEIPYTYLNPVAIENSILLKMARYTLDVTTGDLQYSGTWDHVYVTLIGDRGESERTELDNYGPDFTSGTLQGCGLDFRVRPVAFLHGVYMFGVHTGQYVVKTPASLGKLLLIKVEKEAYFLFPEDEWYCSKVVVKTPEGDSLLFPCYNWISRQKVLELRGGNAVKVFEEDHPLLKEHRKNELERKKKLFDGFELKIKGLLESQSRWECIEDMKKIFWYKRTPLSEYVAEHWNDDEFFGYQFLNAVNPMVIKRCQKLPRNFRVTEEMVQPFLQEGRSLQKELQEGNMFIVDHRRMEGIATRVHNGERLPVADGFCLLYLNPDKKLKPIAIQLYQQPSRRNPVFLPSDSETDWILAKMFIKSADAMDHQIVHHLMNTHYMAEVYAISTLRNLPLIHPLYKLLIPHFRGTLHVNSGGRKALLGPGGPLTITSLGFDGLIELMKRSHAEKTYSTMCLPENIQARGLESIPNFYYRDDGLRLWDIINSFVKAVIEYYYTSADVQKDSELQEWIHEIFVHGYLSRESSGIPSRFSTVEEVIRFVTMVVFNASVQHVAVNGGQFDYLSFLPNGSLLLHQPPPTSKGQSTEESILETLPNIGETVKFAAMLRLLSEKYSDFVPLGKYPEERFNEPAVKKMLEAFQEKLSQFSQVVESRNKQLEIPYTYLNPVNIENSTTI
ncbi:hydroperoxide isomerase ALOXE3-like [Neosynchiropus ocellatus]